ncbi:MAG TPA: methyl-accepting chemotaxis protein [Rhizobacter sp.]|nr:methyl-accepting chemotaxis protein [Rhizobacter sp.]
MFARFRSFFFAPGIAAMQHLSLSRKLVLLVAPPLAGGVLLVLFAQSRFAPPAVAAGAALWVYLVLCFHTSLSASIRALDEMIKAVCAGDLTQSRELKGRDELSHIGRDMEAMTRRLSHLVSSIRSEAQLVAMAGDSLSSSAHALHDRTEEQARSLEQTSHSMASLVGAVQVNAADAQEADGLAARVREAAEGGNAVVESAVASMQGLERRSSQMTDIIGVINGIAFQTNILALNAAVEAARAGEAGRGFAVVASEVRTLAQRCAQAATEVKTLIEGSAAEVGTSMGRIRDASRSLHTVVQGISQVADKARVISQSSAAQRSGLQGMEQSVQSLDGITRSNALMVDSSVRSAEKLREQARQLSSAVIAMKLRQGCADEARALVDKAVALIRSVGSSQAIASFHRRDGGFVDRDLFIIVLDRRGYFRAFGMDPSKADKPAVAAPGVNIDELNAKTMACADAGGGWIEFKSLHPQTKLPVDKMAYVFPADKELIVMCSVNKGDGAAVAPAAAVRAA